MTKSAWWGFLGGSFRNKKFIIGLILFGMIMLALLEFLVLNKIHICVYWRLFFKKKDNRLACSLPKLEPNNSLMDQYYHDVPPLQCLPEEEWVCVSEGYAKICDSFLNSNPEALVTCDYRFIDRVDDHSNRVTSVVRNRTDKVKLETDFFHVDCVLKTSNDTKTWRNLMCGISDRVLNNTTGFPPSSMGLNVLIFGLDSLSHMTYMRKLPKTYEYMTKTLDAVVLNGYNIVGDGTPQALIPMFTGSTEPELPETRKRMGSKANYVNVYPFVWEDYRRSGYVTAYVEDHASTGTFTYRLKGFKDQPTDHYGRPFYLEMDKVLSEHSKYCLAGIPRHKVLLNYIRHFFNRYAKRPKFFFGFHSELSHSDYNLIGLADSDIVDFLKWLNGNGHLDNTLLILMSDHGHRFAEIRETQQGKQEERLPMFSLIFPQEFKTKYQKEWANLQMNANRLTSPFDIYPTLRDVLSYPAKVTNTKSRSISLFKNISAARSCDDAGIESHWCTCLASEDVPLMSPIATKLANAIVDFINNMTLPQRDICHQLNLQDIIRLERYIPHLDLLKYKKNSDYDGFAGDFSDNTTISEIGYQVKLVTVPGDGHFEATLFHLPGRVPDEFKISERSISRVNEYGTTSSCIAQTQHHLLKYCYCKVQLS